MMTVRRLGERRPVSGFGRAQFLDVSFDVEGAGLLPKAPEPKALFQAGQDLLAQFPRAPGLPA